MSAAEMIQQAREHRFETGEIREHLENPNENVRDCSRGAENVRRLIV
jgi:hypothetical protein